MKIQIQILLLDKLMYVINWFLGPLLYKSSTEDKIEDAVDDVGDAVEDAAGDVEDAVDDN